MVSNRMLQVGLMVNPPREGEESYEKYVGERDGILTSLQYVAFVKCRPPMTHQLTLQGALEEVGSGLQPFGGCVMPGPGGCLVCLPADHFEQGCSCRR